MAHFGLALSSAYNFSKYKRMYTGYKSEILSFVVKTKYWNKATPAYIDVNLKSLLRCVKLILIQK